MLEKAQGLYDPQFEHDSCGIGFVVSIKGIQSNRIIKDGLEVLANLEHRGACGCDENTGDGAGLLFQIPIKFLKGKCQNLPERGRLGLGMVFLPTEASQRQQVEDYP